jgi:hypothetical protein
VNNSGPYINDTEKLRRKYEGFNEINFRKGDIVVCLDSLGCKGVQSTCKYTVEEYEVDEKNKKEYLHIRIYTSESKYYISKYNAKRFTLPLEKLLIRKRETKIDTILK